MSQAFKVKLTDVHDLRFKWMGVTFEACKGSGQFRPSGKPKNVAEASSLRAAAGSRCHFVPPHGEKVTPKWIVPL